MQENKTEPYIFILIGILKIIMTVYCVYFVGITVFNISLKEISGKITNINQYEKNFEGKGGKINVKEINYQYTVDGANYFGKRVSNLLIFPDLDFYRDKKITVYYSALFPKYSVLFRADFKYNIYNIFPIIILGIILHIIKVKNNLYDSIIKNKEDKIFTDEFRETVENDDDETIEMEDIFFEETGKGESAIKFLLLLKEHDGMIIESLLKSEQIPYKIEYASVKLRSYKNSIFYILEKDYYDALTVLNEYMRNKTQDEKEEIFIYKRQYGN